MLSLNAWLSVPWKQYYWPNAGDSVISPWSAEYDSLYMSLNKKNLFFDFLALYAATCAPVTGLSFRNSNSSIWGIHKLTGKRQIYHMLQNHLWFVVLSRGKKCRYITRDGGRTFQDMMNRKAEVMEWFSYEFLSGTWKHRIFYDEVACLIWV